MGDVSPHSRRDRIPTPLRILGWTGVVVAACQGCAPAPQCSLPATAAPDPLARIIYVEGAGGDLQPELFAAVAAGLRQAGFSGEILDFQWNTGTGLIADHFASPAYKRERAAELTTLIHQLAEESNAPIDIVAFSAGSVVTAYSLEATNAAHVRNVVFIQSSLSDTHDLSPMLNRMTGRLTNFTSSIDSILLATSVAGTADREFCGPCAIGIGGAIGPPSAAARVCNVPWQPAFLALGHAGGHFDSLNSEFVSMEVAPRLLTATE